MKKILIVEDNEDNMYLINFLLGGKNYKIIEARNGEDGVKLALKNKPDLIIMNIQLPGIDGFEATNIIRKSDLDVNIPIVAVTSCVMIGDREMILNRGFNGYIMKPINPDTFLEEIEKYLQNDYNKIKERSEDEDYYSG